VDKDGEENPARESTEAEMLSRWMPFIDKKFPAEIDSVKELKIRWGLHFTGENNTRAGLFPELAEIRLTNAKRLFEIIRQVEIPKFLIFSDSPWLETRLLRLTGRFEECRQLCQAIPIYSWDYLMLREYIWASQGDSYPHQATDFVTDVGQKKKILETVEYAKAQFDKNLAEWEEAREIAKKGNKTPVSTGGLIIFLGCIAASYFIGVEFLGEKISLVAGNDIGKLIAGIAGMVVGMIFLGSLFGRAGRGNKSQADFEAEWLKNNPPPKFRISDKPPVIRTIP
jgi:hypothetical protein